MYWSEVEYTAGHWSQQAQPLRTQKRQGMLFANGSDRLLLAIVTNDRSSDGASLIRWHYERGRVVGPVRPGTAGPKGVRIAINS